jgi:hypothetical protein
MKLPTPVPVVLRHTKTSNCNLAGSPTMVTINPKSPHPIFRATRIHEGTSHSRTLYTSKALDQSNFII